MQIFAFCLLPIDIQLILQPRLSVQLPLFVKNVNESYQLFFNARYEPAQNMKLYQRKSIFIDNDLDLFERIQQVKNLPVGRFNLWNSGAHRLGGKENILDKICDESQRGMV